MVRKPKESINACAFAKIKTLKMNNLFYDSPELFTLRGEKSPLCRVAGMTPHRETFRKPPAPPKTPVATQLYIPLLFYDVSTSFSSNFSPFSRHRFQPYPSTTQRSKGSRRITTRETFCSATARRTTRSHRRCWRGTSTIRRLMPICCSLSWSQPSTLTASSYTSVV